MTQSTIEINLLDADVKSRLYALYGGPEGASSAFSTGVSAFTKFIDANVQPVRLQGFWDRWAPELREDLAHLVGLIMRRFCGEASAGFRWSSV